MAAFVVNIIILVWIVAASFARAAQERRFNKAVAPIASDSKKSAMTLTRELMAIKKYAKESNDLLVQLMKEELEVPQNASRVYGAILVKGADMRIHMAAAASVHDFIDRSAELVSQGWHAEHIEHLDFFPQKPIEEKMSVEQGAYFLEYARDRYATTVTQKKAIGGIISNYKKAYELA